MIACNFPQLRDALKYGRKVRVNKSTYTLLLVGIGCTLVRALVSMEPIWIVSNVVSFFCIGVIRWKLNDSV